MPAITWNTDVDAPCCPGEILSDDGRSILIQTDTDYCGVATTFGWSVADVHQDSDCLHDSTDGTVDCKECGLSALVFIAAAREWLDNNDGATTDDPGYFAGD